MTTSYGTRIQHWIDSDYFRSQPTPLQRNDHDAYDYEFQTKDYPYNTLARLCRH